MFNEFSSPMFNFLPSPDDNMVRSVTAMIDSLVTSLILAHLFFDVTKNHDQDQCGEERAYYPCCSTSSISKEIRAGTPDRNLNVRTEAETMEGDA